MKFVNEMLLEFIERGQEGRRRPGVIRISVDLNTGHDPGQSDRQIFLLPPLV